MAKDTRRPAVSSVVTRCMSMHAFIVSAAFSAPDGDVVYLRALARLTDLLRAAVSRKPLRATAEKSLRFIYSM